MLQVVVKGSWSTQFEVLWTPTGAGNYILLSALFPSFRGKQGRERGTRHTNIQKVREGKKGREGKKEREKEREKERKREKEREANSKNGVVCSHGYIQVESHV